MGGALSVILIESADKGDYSYIGPTGGDAMGVQERHLVNVAAAMTVLALIAGVPAGAAAQEQPKSLHEDQQLVRAPITERANTVLRSLVAECAMVDGHWERDLGPGCSAIFATLFGYFSGVRRNRPDLIRIGEVTAEGERACLVETLADGRLVAWDSRSATFPGYPALMISGGMGGRAADRDMFRAISDQVIRRLDTLRIEGRDKVLLAVAFSEASLLFPKDGPRLLHAARSVLRPAPHSCYGAMALAAIAKASGYPEDRDRARRLVHNLMSKEPVRDGMPTSSSDMLSFHLALTHAHADLAMIEPGQEFRVRGLQLLDYVFSDAYFDGRVIVHDLNRGGEKADSFCSGCNFWALYLADRFYGDTLVFDPVAEPSVR
jgi:hypothetical protein